MTLHFCLIHRQLITIIRNERYFKTIHDATARVCLSRAHVFGPTILVVVFWPRSSPPELPPVLSVGNLSDQLALLMTPRPVGGEPVVSTPLPPLRIGIVAGHLGNDPGSVCVDANDEVTLTEQEVNLKIATLVQNSLTARGFQVDLLQEYHTHLAGYFGAALVSIHNDSCDYINDQATGFKVAAALDTRDLNRANRLTACLVDRYIPRHRADVPFRQHHARYDRLPFLLGN